MNIIENLRSAAVSVMSNKMRSILTMLGIIIGIGSVIMITSIGSGFERSITGQFEQMGMSALMVYINYQKQPAAPDYLGMSDVDVVKQHPNVAYAAPTWEMGGSVYLKNPRETEMCYFSGTTGDYRFVQNIELINGRFLSEPDVANYANVAVIDEALSRRVFGRSNSIGDTIRVSTWAGSLELTVIGITKAPEYSDMFDMPPFIQMPITTLMQMYSSTTVDYIYVTVDETENMSDVAGQLARLLSITHSNEDMYVVENLAAQMDIVSETLGYVTGFVALVAAISLLVGGIGVMNIMLVTVTERTREIGVRKSLGATEGNILFQFLTEAMILTAIGGIIGIVLGYGGAFALGGTIDIMPQFSGVTMALTVAVSGLIGIISGVYPAYKASMLDPINALRYE